MRERVESLLALAIAADDGVSQQDEFMQPKPAQWNQSTMRAGLRPGRYGR